VKLRSVLVLVTVWALTVVAVALITWQVIHTAGRGVLDETAVPTLAQPSPSSASPSPDSVWQPAETQAASGRPSASTADPTPTPSDPASPDASPSQPTSAPSHPAPSHGPTHSSSSPPAGPGGHHDPPTSTPTPTEAPGATVDSWRGAAGVVTVSCEPGRIRLLGATPADGYRLELEQEQDKIQVHFAREEPADEVQVAARCSNGTPHFDVEQGDRPHEDRPVTS
jgi:hypothetical protein